MCVMVKRYSVVSGMDIEEDAKVLQPKLLRMGYRTRSDARGFEISIRALNRAGHSAAVSLHQLGESMKAFGRAVRNHKPAVSFARG